jgi:hypothetical protein
MLTKHQGCTRSMRPRVEVRMLRLRPKMPALCVNVDSKFSYKFVSRPLSGRRMDTPGVVGAEESAERGRTRY